MATNAPGTYWRDSLLQKAARGRVDLPLQAHERSRGQQYRHMARIAAITALAVAAGLAALLIAVLVASGSKGGSAADLATIAAVLVLGLPAGIGILIFFILWPSMLWGVRDGNGHPYGFEATADEFAVTTSDGARLAGPWSRWRYQGNRCATLKGSPTAVITLQLALDGHAIEIDVPRTRRGRQLLRAVLQRLAAYGGAAA